MLAVNSEAEFTLYYDRCVVGFASPVASDSIRLSSDCRDMASDSDARPSSSVLRMYDESHVVETHTPIRQVRRGHNFAVHTEREQAGRSGCVPSLAPLFRFTGNHLSSIGPMVTASSTAIS